ncbi:MAG: hypothetical protein ACR2QE_17670 [Acidimicrobiales bacterium]
MITRCLVLVAVLLLTACGSNGDDAAGPPSSSTSAPSPSSSAEPTASSTTTTIAGCTDDALIGGTVSTVGFDDITFGMTVVSAETASGVCLEPDRPINNDCYYVLPVPGPDGVAFLVTEGTIERIDVFAGSVTTRSGLGLGSSEQDVVDRFGAGLTIGQHPSGAGNELVFVPSDEADAAFRVIFETDGTVVTGFRSGRVPQVTDAVVCGGPGPVVDEDEDALSQE